MAELSEQERPSFGPVQANLPYYRSRSSYKSLATIQDPNFDPRLPYTWGFTIYRVPFEGDSDERFATALQRFTQWSKWVVRESRYSELSLEPTAPKPPATGDSTDHLADRFYNEVIQLDPSIKVITAPEGQENFSAVGQEFSQWVAGLNLDPVTLENNPRYKHCLVIDENALKTLEALPDTLPPLEYDIAAPPDGHGDSWVWVLDRTTCEAFLQGQDMEFPPWLRLHLEFFLDIWFGRAQRGIDGDWQGLAQEDFRKWETVRWWSPDARLLNRTSRASRAPGVPTIKEQMKQFYENQARELEKKKKEEEESTK